MEIRKRFEQKNCNFLPILAKLKLYKALFNNSVAMAPMDVPWDWFVFKMKAY